MKRVAIRRKTTPVMYRRGFKSGNPLHYSKSKSWNSRVLADGVWYSTDVALCSINRVAHEKIRETYMMFKHNGIQMYAKHQENLLKALHHIWIRSNMSSTVFSYIYQIFIIVKANAVYMLNRDQLITITWRSWCSKTNARRQSNYDISSSRIKI